jgi:hypothetical protein
MPLDPRPFELAFTSVEYLKSRNYKCDLLSPRGIGGVLINAVEYSKNFLNLNTEIMFIDLLATAMLRTITVTFFSVLHLYVGQIMVRELYS